jgi:hypothetical protein
MPEGVMPAGSVAISVLLAPSMTLTLLLALLAV